MKIRNAGKLMTPLGIICLASCASLSLASRSVKPPEPVGGYRGIERNMVYPKEASEEGVEGTVEVHAFVDSSGKVLQTRVEKGFPSTGLNEAATDAIRNTPWRPATKAGRPVGMWVKIPVIFSLGRMTQPVPVGGYGSIARGIVRPDTALAAGIEDSMMVRIYVDWTGRVTDIVILKGLLNTGLNTLATDAIRQTQFRPGTFGGSPQGVWIAISVSFRSGEIIVLPVGGESKQ